MIKFIAINIKNQKGGRVPTFLYIIYTLFLSIILGMLNGLIITTKADKIIAPKTLNNIESFDLKKLLFNFSITTTPKYNIDLPNFSTPILLCQQTKIQSLLI